ncbi:MAG: ABC transporter ATP-binding protein [Verrucomicrobiota bacterium]
MATNNTLLELTDVSKSYPDESHLNPATVLKQLNLEVQSGESLAVVGPSGCGKSTLLNVAGGLDRPDLGTVEFDNRSLDDLSENELAQLRNTEFGFIFQEHHLLPQCTVLENVLVPTIAGHSGGQAKAERRTRAKELLETVCLDDRLNAFPAELSGGERQRVATVRALINQPSIVFADEPTGALDRTTADNLVRLLQRLRKDEAITLVVVTHDTWLADQMDRVLELRNGKLA